MGTAMKNKREYKKRLYKCGACGTEQMVGTNHIGRIYSACKNCEHTGLVCMEPEAVAARNKIQTIPTVLHFYRFDISNRGEHADYGELKKKLQEMGLVMFDSLARGHSKLMRTVKQLDGDAVHLETKWIFDNQWNATNGLRLFDWAQPIFPNPDIKTGYWLEQTPEMDMLRSSHRKCGYCGTILTVQEGGCKKHPECKGYGMRELLTPQRKKAIGSE